VFVSSHVVGTMTKATAKAREKVNQMRRKRDVEGADTDTWLRIIVAIGTLGTPPPKARH
jgi:hypothetical protein